MSKDNELVRVVSGSGDHYSINEAKEGMELLKTVFPDAEANHMNFCLFSTSGVHGTYVTIEEEEECPGIGVTFVIVHPRMVRMQYGTAYPETEYDFEYLKRLRASSREVVARDIGA